jgi:hypothetical protein
MKTFNQFIVESDDALNRLNHRRQVAKDKNKSGVQSFKQRSAERMMDNKQKNIKMQQEYKKKQKQMKRMKRGASKLFL